MKAITLFGGAGGACQGLKEAGLDVIAVLERDSDAVATLKANGLPAIQADLKDYDWSAFARRRIGLVEGGPPCQPFSTAGRLRGQWDERDCIPAYIDAIAAIRPRIFVMENVRGLTYKTHRPYLDTVVKRFEALGYTVEWRVLNAADFGVPQRRQRLFVVGRRDGVAIRWPEPTHDKADAMGRLPWVTMAGALGWPTNLELKTGVNTRIKAGPYVNWRDVHGPQVVSCDLPAPTVDVAAGSRWKVRRRIEWPVLPDTISLQRRQNGAPPIDTRTQPAPTVTVTGIATSQWEVTTPDGETSKLSVAEAALLQDFPADWKFIGRVSAQLRQIGNACPRRLTQAVVGAQVGTWAVEEAAEVAS